MAAAVAAESCPSASVWQEKSSAKARSLRCITAKLARCQSRSSRNSCSIAVMYCAESADVPSPPPPLPPLLELLLELLACKAA